MSKVYVVTMVDGSEWGVPVDVIARSRADYYKDEVGGDLQRSLDEDTYPLFESDESEIHDWASNNMNWSDVRSYAWKIKDRKPLTERDFQEAWVNGEHEVRELP